MKCDQFYLTFIEISDTCSLVQFYFGITEVSKAVSHLFDIRSLRLSQLSGITERSLRLSHLFGVTEVSGSVTFISYLTSLI